MAAMLAARAASSQGSDTSSVKRTDTANDYGLNYTISEELMRRTMQLPRTRGTGRMWGYYRTQLVDSKYTPVVWEVPEGESDFNSAIFVPIGGDQAESVAVDGLCGCTVLVVASRTGVYAAHYFETLAFDTADIWLAPKGPFTDDNDAFLQTVIGGLTNGIQGVGSSLFPQKPEQVSLTSVAATINAGAGPDPVNDNKIKGYLFFPAQQAQAGPIQNYAMYQSKFQQIKQTVGQIIPALRIPTNPAETNPLWTDIQYTALENNNPLVGDSAHGVLLFKYDPDHEGKKKAALWTEDDSTDKHNDQWVD